MTFVLNDLDFGTNKHTFLRNKAKVVPFQELKLFFQKKCATKKNLNNELLDYFDFFCCSKIDIWRKTVHIVHSLQSCTVTNFIYYRVVPRIVQPLLQHDPKYKARKLSKKHYNYINIIQTSYTDFDFHITRRCFRDDTVFFQIR